MNKLAHLILFLIVALSAQAEEQKSQLPLADPYILLDGGKYYIYGTHDADGICCYSSDDLKTWKPEGQALNAANTTETRWFWAPEVYHLGDKYIMYYSANEHLYAATSKSPTGPFVQVGPCQMEKLIGNEKCIDSSVFFDEDGTAYILFVRFTDGNCIWQAQLDKDYITPIPGTMKKCFSATADWELKQAKVVEGPNVVKHKKRYYLTYSANDYRSREYAVGYATSRDMAFASWKKFDGNPILHRRDNLVGTGHHSLFTDKDGKLRIVFHAHYSEDKIHPRLTYIGTAQFKKSKLQITDEPIIRPVCSNR